MSKALAFFIVAGLSPALADEAPKPPPAPPNFLTAEDGRQLVEYGIRVGIAQGLARAEIAAAQQAARGVLEKIVPLHPAAATAGR